MVIVFLKSLTYQFLKVRASNSYPLLYREVTDSEDPADAGTFCLVWNSSANENHLSFVWI